MGEGTLCILNISFFGTLFLALGVKTDPFCDSLRVMWIQSKECWAFAGDYAKKKNYRISPLVRLSTAFPLLGTSQVLLLVGHNDVPLSQLFDSLSRP